MPRSKTVARNRTFPAINPEWPAARKAHQRRWVLKKMAKLRRSMAAAQTGAPPCYPPSGPASREDPCEAAANTPSMPR